MRRFVAGLLLLCAGCSRQSSAPASPTSPTTSTPPPVATPAPPPATPVSTVVQLNDDLGGRRLFPSDNWWNQDVSSAPVDPQSDALINFIGRTRALHPDFGPPT